MSKQPLTELKERVYKIVDDWLELGDLEDRPIESESDFEDWVQKKIAAGTELSSFAEEVIDVLLGQFKGTDDLFAQVISDRDSDKWDEGAAKGSTYGDTAISLNPMHANPYRKQEEA